MKFDKAWFKKFFSRLYAKFNDDDISSRAAQVAFYFAFALFPLLLFLLSVLGMVLEGATDLRAQLFNYLRDVMPSSAFDLVSKTIEEVVEKSSGSKLTVGLLITLYSASAGIDNVRIALNGVYNLKETRSWWKTKLLSIIITLAIGVLAALALGLVFYGTHLLQYVLPVESPYVLKPLEYLTLLIVLLLAFGVIYNFLPNHSPLQWKWLSPGTIAGIVLWLIFSNAFRLYLNYFDTYAKTYGSLGAVIILLLWLYLTALVILFGGAINAIFDEFSGIKKKNIDRKQQIEEKAGTSTASKNDKGDEAKSIEKTDDKSVSPPTEDMEKADDKTSAPENSAGDDKPKSGKVIRLVAGILIGMFSRKKKD